MSINTDQKQEIKTLLIEKITKKLENYSPETHNMPFHTRLLGKERMALFSFIQSINTMLGTSIFEQISVILAKPIFKVVQRQYKGLPTYFKINLSNKIQEIMNNLKSKEKTPNKLEEISILANTEPEGENVQIGLQVVDLFLVSKNDFEYYIDLKTVKPNISSFWAYKRTLLEWVALRQTIGKFERIKTMLAIPYNPYEPEPYQRWTLKGTLDIKEELLVAEDFWDFIGGVNTYSDLLEIFFEVGQELHPKIEERFKSI